MSEYEWRLLDDADKKRQADQKAYKRLWELDMIEAGLCVRRAGLIWRLPLCHDSYGAGW